MNTRIEKVTFRHYKALGNYSVSIEHVNILTGANNSGKSTVIGAFRVLAVALRAARKSRPERIALETTHYLGYRIKETLVPISLENVATDYESGASRVSFYLTNGNALHLHFDPEAGCVLVPETRSGTLRTAADFKSHFPISLTVIPVLGPVEHKESLREVDTVTTSLSTHRASRHFRNYWYHFPEGFDKFSALIEATWPGMRIGPPELNGTTGLNMFVAEDRIARELYWVGFGFQIWCQLLTHLHRVDPSTMVVIDEPEVYLHPEIQRKLLHVIKDTGADILVATHSREIVQEASPGEVLHIDKRKNQAERKERVRWGTGDSFSNNTGSTTQSIDSVFPSMTATNRSISIDTAPINQPALEKATGATLGLHAVSPPSTGVKGHEDGMKPNLGGTVLRVSAGEVIVPEQIVGSREAMRVGPSQSTYPASRAMNSRSELEVLLIRAKAIGIKIEDRRGEPGGKIYTALQKVPDESTVLLLKKLVEHGLEVFPGKKYLK